MEIPISDLLKKFSGKHLNVHDACAAEMNGQKGVLGVSSGIYTRVWFDTEEGSKTLFTSKDKYKALAKFADFKRRYGK